MKQILKAALLVGAVATWSFFIVGSMTMMWMMNQSREREDCYRSGAALVSCGGPSFIERKIAHYLAHVDL